LKKSMAAMMRFDGEFPQGPWLAFRRGIPTWRSQFRSHPGMECRYGLSARDRAYRQAD
jgi:hypothetical protein